jgi:hypothetical protein
MPLTRLPIGFSAASSERSAALPLSSAGTRPLATSGQKLMAAPNSDICAAAAPSASAAAFSLTARIVSAPTPPDDRPASAASSGIRIMMTAGASMRFA